MENTIVVGTGDLYYRFLAPTLDYMNKNREINILATVDIKPKPLNDELFPKTKHIIRTENQKLSELLADFKDMNPVVILGHAHHFHLSDAKDLLLNGFKVVVEKPYSVSKSELDELKILLKKFNNRIVLLDYYLKRKAIPLIHVFGAINKGNFYHNTEEVMLAKEMGKTKLDFYGKIKNLIGDPVSVKAYILEGNDDSGRLENRGIHLYNVKYGGGMIHDLGLHAVAPLFLMKNYIGEIDKKFKNGKVRIAQSREYLNKSMNLYPLSEKEVAETYAEFVFSTSKKVPVSIFVGKYVSNIEDQKKIVIVGKKGSLKMDLYKNVLYLMENNREKKIIELVNSKHLRYYPVIKSAIEILNKRNPFKFDVNKVLFDSQEFILNVVSKSRQKNTIRIYNSGEEYYNVFSAQDDTSFGKLGSLNRGSFNSFFKDYSKHLGKLLNGIDTKHINKISEVILEARKNNNTIFFIGNGGSAATASHFAQDLAEVGRKIKTKVFNSISLTDNISAITATANDHGYNNIFSVQMQGIFKRGDVLIAISASGNSPNILEAVKFAKERGGTVIGLTGFDGGKLLPMCDYFICAKTEKGEYGPVEDIHMIFDHILTTYLYYKLKEEIE